MSITTEPRTPEAIRTALEDLVSSDGWAILTELVEAQFGDAALVSQFRASLVSMKAADRLEQEASYAILQAASDAAKSVLALPYSKLNAVTEHKPRTRLFEQFRRGPQSA